MEKQRLSRGGPDRTDPVRLCGGDPNPWPEFVQPTPDEVPNDHFVTRDGETYAGTHLIVDFYDARALDDIGLMEETLREAVARAEATLLHIHLHRFTPGGGISGVAVLAESHISVHTWPERGFAAFDVFLCGATRPERAVEVLDAVFRPARSVVSELHRGRRMKADGKGNGHVAVCV